MSRRLLSPERIVAQVDLDRRAALVIEQLDNGKVLVWRCSRSPAGHAALATASRVFALPFAVLGDVAEVLRRLHADQPSSEKRRVA